jgi:hypothetical protein
MLNRIGYYGVYKDNDISVSIMLENPLEYGLDAELLVFSVVIKPHSGDVVVIQLNDFAFYIMDADNRLYNAYVAPDLRLGTGVVIDTDDPPHTLRALITADFKHEYLYQALRVAFYYKPCNRVELIRLEH